MASPHLSSDDADQKIKQMISFIEQEAKEKAEEIDQKAEEEFNIEKGRLVQEAKRKITEHYDKKEKQIELQKRIQNSQLQNRAKLRVLEVRQDYIDKLKDEGREKMRLILNDKQQYGNLIGKLLLQGFLQLLEPEVVVRCRQCDVGLVNQAMPRAVEAYKKQSGRNVNVNFDNNSFISSASLGGVEIFLRTGKIRVVNTIENRLEMTFNNMLPVIRHTLFGANPRRAHFD